MTSHSVALVSMWTCPHWPLHACTVGDGGYSDSLPNLYPYPKNLPVPVPNPWPKILPDRTRLAGIPVPV